MNAGRTVFSQLIEFLSHQEFQKCVARYAVDRYLKNLSCWDQYLAMAFAPLTYRESLRDIEACLRSVVSCIRQEARFGAVAGRPRSFLVRRSACHERTVAHNHGGSCGVNSRLRESSHGKSPYSLMAASLTPRGATTWYQRTLTKGALEWPVSRRCSATRSARNGNPGLTFEKARKKWGRVCVWSRPVEASLRPFL